MTHSKSLDKLVRFLVAGEYQSIRLEHAPKEFERALREAYLKAGGSGRIANGALDWTDSIRLRSSNLNDERQGNLYPTLWLEFEKLIPKHPP